MTQRYHSPRKHTMGTAEKRFASRGESIGLVALPASDGVVVPKRKQKVEPV